MPYLDILSLKLRQRRRRARFSPLGNKDCLAVTGADVEVCCMFTHPGLTFRMLQSLDEFYVRNITARNYVIIWQYSVFCCGETADAGPAQRQKAPAGALAKN
jgi:hypothetical protein